MSRVVNVINEEFKLNGKTGLSAGHLIFSAYFIIGFIMFFSMLASFSIPGSLMPIPVAVLISAGILLFVKVVKAEKRAEQAKNQDFKNALLEMAKTFERQSSININDYARFLITLEYAVKVRKIPTPQVREHILEAFKDMVIEKMRRISGFDYVGLEKELLKPQSNIDSGRKLFTKEQVRVILEDFEKIREAIRDRALTVN